MRAFTLVEIMISTVILSIFMVGLYVVLNTGETTYYTDTGLLILQQQARHAIDRMVKELRNAAAPTISDSSRKITFNTKTENNVKYYLDTTNNRIMRQVDTGTPQVVANYVTALTFCCYSDTTSTCTSTCTDSNLAEILLTASSRFAKKDSSFSLKGQARMRNE